MALVLDRLARKAHRGFRVIQDLRVLQGLRAPKGLSGQPGLPVPTVHLERKDLLDLKGYRDWPVLMVLLDRQDLLVRRDLKALRVRQVLIASPVWQYVVPRQPHVDRIA